VAHPARRPLVAGNWKMHHDHLQAIRVVSELGARLTADTVARVEVSVHPAFTALRSVQTVVEDRALPVVLGAQHCAPVDSGAFTGEVSPAMLARLGVRYVLVGHSERRRLFGQDDTVVAATAAAVCRHGMVPVLCVGETEEERDAGRTAERLTAQVGAGLAELVRTGLPGAAPSGTTGSSGGVARTNDTAPVASLVVAYEPVWAIGSGATPSAEDVQEASATVRGALADVLGEQVAAAVRVLYGGSVTAANTGELLHGPDVDGVLVGGASLQAESFAAIAAAAAAAALAATGRRR